MQLRLISIEEFKVGDGKWETNGVKVNHPTPRLGFDAFESRSTLADPR
jgi:hypothetical protein